MSLTIKEKEHWKERIEARITNEIKRLKSQDPAFFSDIETAARKQAAIDLGIAEDLKKCEALEEAARQKREELEILQETMTDSIKKRFRHLNHRYYHADSLIEQALKEKIPDFETQLMKSNEKGSRILKLENEKETLLDTIWLATSAPQIRDLWVQVDQLLGKGSSALQSNILNRKNQ